MIDPHDIEAQIKAFSAASYSVCSALPLKFDYEKFQKSRELDPIVAVCPTGIFDFFVNLFGADWLKWWQDDRVSEWGYDVPMIKIRDEFEDLIEAFKGLGLLIELDESATISQGEFFETIEQLYLTFWRIVVTLEVHSYCLERDLRIPNRCTAVQPSGTKALLTGASPGWHPPKSQRFIRRITIKKNHPVALAAQSYGYNIIPAVSAKDENGRLLDDINDERVNEWLIEVPTEVSWANLPGVGEIDISKFSFKSQASFYMQVQRCYTGHNCFSRDTEFLTDKGIKSFYDFSEGDFVTVLNKNGDWVESKVVRTHDQRQMYDVTIRQGSTGKTKVIRSTGCHRFPVKRVSGGNSKIHIITAENLKPGMRLVTNNSRTPILLDRFGIQNGIVYGDGTLASSGKYSQVALCQLKRELKTYFDKSAVERDDMDQSILYCLNPELKSLPSEDCTQEYLAGFFAGLLASDGSIDGSVVSLSTKNPDTVEFLQKHLPRLGVIICQVREIMPKTGYKPGEEYWEFTFSKESIQPHFILRTFHKEKFFAKGHQPRQWKVISVKASVVEEGWCVMEPETNHFTLTDNILTMNTSATLEYREHEIPDVAQWLYDQCREGEYVSAAMMARFDANETFPRLPFEPISQEKYQELMNGVLERRISDDFEMLMSVYDQGVDDNSDKIGCEGIKCEVDLINKA